jgi:hypothetical protein
MAGRRRLTSMFFPYWPDMNALAKEWKAFIERCDSWSWGPGFHVEDGDHGRVVNYIPTGMILAGEATSTITARSGSTVGGGTFKVRTLSGSTLSDGATGLPIKSNFSTAVVSGKAIMVGSDGGTYWLLSADCP